MSDNLVDKIARAVLYEGYILYPYRPSVKSRQRWTFGGIFPRDYTESQPTDPSILQTQCLLTATPAAKLFLTLRFLHLTDRIVEPSPAFARVESLRVGNNEFQSWQEAVEREFRLDNISLDNLLHTPQSHAFSFPGENTLEILHDGDQVAGRLRRERRALQGTLELSAKHIAENAFQLTISIANHTRTDTQVRDLALLSSLASTHLVLTIQNGEFLSLADPPAALLEPARRCNNIGCWPVLVGEAHQTDTLLVSPIILPDYPQIAPESPGDLFDGCEIDEILSLRIMTLTDDEKRQAAAVDPRVRHMLERTENLAREQLMNLHGTVRGVPPIPRPPEPQHA